MAGAIRHPLLQWLIYAHLWLALCLAAQVSWIGLFLSSAPDLWRYNIAVALGTIATYGLMRWVRSREPKLRESEHLRWFSERYVLMLVLCALSGILAAVLCWPFTWQVMRWLIPASVLAFFYVSPFTGNDGLTIGLRRVPMIKGLLIALVVALVVVAVPMEYDLKGHSMANILFMVCMRIPLFMAIAIAFDIRDAPFDPPVLRTLPQVLGPRAARLLALFLLLLAALFEHIFLRNLGYGPSAWAILVGYAFATVLIAMAKPERSPVFYAILLDGVLILIPLCVWIGTIL